MSKYFQGHLTNIKENHLQSIDLDYMSIYVQGHLTNINGLKCQKLRIVILARWFVCL